MQFFYKTMELIKSPLNYTGNKFRILNQIQPYFPKEINTMVDLFCGGATVSINTKCKNRICIDNNDKVIGLLEYLSECQYEKIMTKISSSLYSRNKYGNHSLDENILTTIQTNEINIENSTVIGTKVVEADNDDER